MSINAQLIHIYNKYKIPTDLGFDVILRSGFASVSPLSFTPIKGELFFVGSRKRGCPSVWSCDDMCLSKISPRRVDERMSLLPAEGIDNIKIISGDGGKLLRVMFMGEVHECNLMSLDWDWRCVMKSKKICSDS